MTASAPWTLDELTARVGEALGAASDVGTYPGAPNGRVRELPDRRAIRWYVTRGLLDRPVTRGRTVGYGPRHLLQLVVIKRLQASGRALADIQAELVGASDARLRELAGVPEALLAGVPASGGGGGVASASTGGDEMASASTGGDDAAPARTRFWAASDPPAAASPGPAVLTGLPLGGGAILLLPAMPDPDLQAAIHAAARPLLDLLTDRGLLSPPQRSPR
ncbi:MAG TPA: MerR family transcriptional regulator [Micromonosporaceae bacterium]|nr:MerR family transcriptional regulator [Micromonosporaceae bacterium]